VVISLDSLDANDASIDSSVYRRCGLSEAVKLHFIPEEIHVLATKLAAYVSSDSTTAKVTNVNTAWADSKVVTC